MHEKIIPLSSAASLDSSASALSLADLKLILISCSLDYLIERIWDELGLVKVYTKKRGAHPDLTDPICLRKGATVEVWLLSPRVLCAGISDGG